MAATVVAIAVVAASVTAEIVVGGEGAATVPATATTAFNNYNNVQPFDYFYSFILFHLVIK